MVPYNAPNSAYDLLLRLLTHKKFIDVETPQIRIKSDVPKKDNIGEQSFMYRHSHNSVAEKHETEQRSVERVPLQQERASIVMPMGFALLAGFALGAVLFRKRHAQRGEGYRRVPDVATD